MSTAVSSDLGNALLSQLSPMTYQTVYCLSPIQSVYGNWVVSHRKREAHILYTGGTCDKKCLFRAQHQSISYGGWAASPDIAHCVSKSKTLSSDFYRNLMFDLHCSDLTGA